jgi:hypothetical protein
MDHRQVGEELFWVGVVYVMFFVIPTGALQENAVDIASVLRFFLHVVVGHSVQNFDLEVDAVHGYHVLTGVVLEGAGDEGLREEEAGNPKDIGSASVDPLL